MTIDAIIANMTIDAIIANATTLIRGLDAVQYLTLSIIGIIVVAIKAVF